MAGDRHEFASSPRRPVHILPDHRLELAVWEVLFRLAEQAPDLEEGLDRIVAEQADALDVLTAAIRADDLRLHGFYAHSPASRSAPSTTWATSSASCSSSRCSSRALAAMR